MSANVEADSTIKQLDRKADPDENITEDAVKDSKQLARFLLRLFRDVASLKRRWSPRRLDFRGAISTGSLISPARLTFQHNFGGPVVYWLVRLTNPTGADNTLIVEVEGTDENKLVVDVYFPATFTLRIEESG